MLIDFTEDEEGNHWIAINMMGWAAFLKAVLNSH